MSIDKFPNREQEFTPPLQKWFSSIYDAFKNFSTKGDVIVDSSSRGFVIKDSAGNYWRVSINTSGSLTTTNLGQTRPQGI